jgi:predicted DNA-binding protein
MSAPKKFMPQQVALAEADRVGLSRLAAEQGKAKSELARDAIRWYLQNHETVEKTERDDKLAKVMLKCTDRIIGVIANSTNRICSLLVRNAIDTNITMMLFYRMLPEDKADSIMAKMYRLSATRLQRKLSPEELDIAKMIKEGLEQVTVAAPVPEKS